MSVPTTTLRIEDFPTLNQASGQELEKLLRALNNNTGGLVGATGALQGAAALGTRWRLKEAPYPGASSPVCLLVQNLVSGQWATVCAFGSDGTDSRRCAAIYLHAAAQNNIGKNVYNTLNFTQRELDTDGACSGWIFTCPAGKGGLYHVSTAVTAAAAAVSDAIYFALFKNTSLLRRLTTFIASSTGWGTFGGSCDVTLSPGDYVNVQIYSSNAASGVNVQGDASNYISIHRVIGT